MFKKLIVVGTVALCFGAVTAPAAPAATVDVVDVRGIIQVGADYGACGHVRFMTVQPVITGAFSGAAIVSQGSSHSTVRGSVPILAFNTDHVMVCIPGSGLSPTSGAGSYILTATGASGDTATVKNCITYTPGGLPFQCYHL